jgi:hypothetical protein
MVCLLAPARQSQEIHNSGILLRHSLFVRSLPQSAVCMRRLSLSVARTPVGVSTLLVDRGTARSIVVHSHVHSRYSTVSSCRSVTVSTAHPDSTASFIRLLSCPFLTPTVHRGTPVMLTSHEINFGSSTLLLSSLNIQASFFLPS